MQVEDRPIVKEIKTYIREHHPIEKEFVVETRPTGEQSPLTRILLQEFLLAASVQI